ncbi:MAG: M28 family peptidase [Candidatus Omnitrophica bacterium]|nr:M28 family peptidase [Candidatus Omnitrophota bacterium]
MILNGVEDFVFKTTGFNLGRIGELGRYDFQIFKKKLVLENQRIDSYARCEAARELAHIDNRETTLILIDVLINASRTNDFEVVRCVSQALSNNNLINNLILKEEDLHYIRERLLNFMQPISVLPEERKGENVLIVLLEELMDTNFHEVGFSEESVEIIEVEWEIGESKERTTQRLLGILDKYPDRAIITNVSAWSYPLSGDLNGILPLETVKELGRRGVIFVASAGNAGIPQIPGEFMPDNLVLVGGSDFFQDPFGSTNFGVSIQISAPTSDITGIKGTSFAAPRVSAAIAALLTEFPQFSQKEAIQALYVTASPIEGDSWSALLYTSGLIGPEVNLWEAQRYVRLLYSDSAENIQRVVYDLTAFGARLAYPRSEEIVLAEHYLRKQFEEIGLPVVFQEFYIREYKEDSVILLTTYGLQEYPAKRWADQPVIARNIIATLPGKRYPEKVLIIAAHYDGLRPGGSANDNASGVAVVLEVARFLREYDFDYTIQFVLFSGEEGILGSSYFLKERLKQDPLFSQNLICTVVVDMVGNVSYLGEESSSAEKEDLDIITVPEYLDFAREFVRGAAYVSGFEIEISEFTQEGAFSDDYAFIKKGLCGILFSEDTIPELTESGGLDHSQTDMPNAIDFDFTENVAKALAFMIIKFKLNQKWITSSNFSFPSNRYTFYRSKFFALLPFRSLNLIYFIFSYLSIIIQKNKSYLVDRDSGTTLYYGLAAIRFLRKIRHDRWRFPLETQIIIPEGAKVTVTIEGSSFTLDGPGGIYINPQEYAQVDIIQGNILIVTVSHRPDWYEEYNPEHHLFNRFGYNNSGVVWVKGGVVVYSLRSKRNLWNGEPTEWITDSMSFGGLNRPPPFVGVSYVASPLFYLQGTEGADFSLTVRFPEVLHRHLSFEGEKGTQYLIEVYINLEGRIGLLVFFEEDRPYLYVLNPGDMLAVPPGVIHEILVSGLPYKHLVVQIPSTFHYGVLFKETLSFSRFSLDREALIKRAIDILKRGKRGRFSLLDE